ncbi:hypothetical protein DFH27DRAFT_613813 [Peziza echinospora]|nr:hypothetical protein DFH27DRAFT_613813 [Peziza echinospora]
MFPAAGVAPLPLPSLASTPPCIRQASPSNGVRPRTCGSQNRSGTADGRIRWLGPCGGDRRRKGAAAWSFSVGPISIHSKHPDAGGFIRSMFIPFPTPPSTNAHSACNRHPKRQRLPAIPTGPRESNHMEAMAATLRYRWLGITNARGPAAVGTQRRKWAGASPPPEAD